MLKSKPQQIETGDRGWSPLRDGVDVDFNILTAFIRLGRAGPVRGRVPSIIIIIGFVPSIIIVFDFDVDLDFKLNG